ncbi:MAG: thiol peroxidase [Campylobacteraceae bacterium]
MSVTFKGSPVSLGDVDLKVGDKAPIVSLIGSDLSTVKVGGESEKIQILVVVPSLDTAVCANETRKFNVEAAKLEKATVVVISMDLPFASGRFCTTEGIANLKVASDFRSKEFSKKYGVLLKDSPLEGLSTRAIFVVNTKGEVVYKELVPEITSEPDYAKAIAAVKASCGCGCSK